MSTQPTFAQQLAEDRRIIDAATKGPWLHATHSLGLPNPNVVDMGRPPKAHFAVCHGEIDLSANERNAAFIAASRIGWDTANAQLIAISSALTAAGFPDTLSPQEAVALLLAERERLILDLACSRENVAEASRQLMAANANATFWLNEAMKMQWIPVSERNPSPPSGEVVKYLIVLRHIETGKQYVDVATYYISPAGDRFWAISDAFQVAYWQETPAIPASPPPTSPQQ